METERLTPRHFLALLAIATAVLVAGCGNDSKPDLVNGKTLFVQNCGACHVLKRAGTKGVSGPNLDDAFSAARSAGMGPHTIKSVVLGQIALPGKTGYNVPDQYVMPADLVTGPNARDVAAYVNLVAGAPGEDTGKLALAGGGDDAKSVFTNNGGSCHTLADAGTAGKTGTNLDLIGKKGAAYIDTAIVKPNAKIAPGFSAGVMPQTYGTDLTPEELKKLVEYLAGQK